MLRRSVELTSEHPTALRPDVQHVGVTLAPGRVRHRCDQRVHALAARIDAVVETDRVKAVPERAQLGKGRTGPAGRTPVWSATKSRTARSSGTAGSPK